MPVDITENLRMTAQVTVSALDAEARAEVADLDQWPMAQIVEVLDERTCPLCESVDGMILDRRSPEYERWRQPSHINCRRTMAYVAADEVELGPDGEPRPVTPDFVEPPQDLIDKHGHFVVDPEKYAPLRVPAEPEGRDFIFVRTRDPDSGEMVSVMKWRVFRYDIPGLKPETIHIDISGGKAWYPPSMEDVLRREPVHVVARTEFGMTGAQRARIGEYDVIYKPEPPAERRSHWDPGAEEAAYVVDRELGINLVPPTVARRLPSGEWEASAQLRDANAWDCRVINWQLLRRATASVACQKLRWFDDFIGYHDRPGNWLVDVTRGPDEPIRVVAIDHGGAFLRSGFMARRPDWATPAGARELANAIRRMLGDDRVTRRLVELIGEDRAAAFRDNAQAVLKLLEENV